MQDTKTFKQSELILKVSHVYDTNKLDLGIWLPFIDKLCGDRWYQKEAIKTAIIFLASEQYKSLSELASYNYTINSCLRDKYQSEDNFLKVLQMREKLYGDIDLATGTGKSYVIYGIAQIALGLGLVKRVLVLCPSLTIESGLTEKFVKLSSDPSLKATIPENAECKNPRIVSASETIKNGDLCVENIHAVYENTGSSISDSFEKSGEDTLVLNDEAHHIFNRSSEKDSSIKKWKEFLLDEKYQFKYMLGFTGTAYIEDEYFQDVIYRYSLRQAIEDHIVKNIDYVKEDESKNDYEKFQKIYQNHRDNIDRYPLVKPISIIVTRDISHAKNLYDDFISFLASYESKEKKEVESKVLIVTSAREHKVNLTKLKYVDKKDDKVEWIISVSMLTEGWDVKNVFQIVPWEDRAFNSKLLVSQVLGRGLRLPDPYHSPQPRVVIFNHKSWGSKIKRLVDEVLEIETRINSIIVSSGERCKFHFNVRNINYSIEQTEVEKPAEESNKVDFTRLLTEGIALESQSVEIEKGTTYESILGATSRERNYAIRNITWTIDEVVDKLFEEFEQREWEGRTLKLGDNEYTKNTLPPREVIEKIVRLSMLKRGNNGNDIIETNVHKILTAFTPLLRKNKKSTVSKSIANDVYVIDTQMIAKQSISLSMLRQDRTVFYTNNWQQEIDDEEQKKILKEVIEDESLPKSSSKEIDYCQFKTPVTTVLTSSKPERKFVELLCKKDNANLIFAWIKSRDRNFYEIEYSCKYGSANSKTRKYFHDKFNPDFFIKIIKDDYCYYLVVEIKEDKDNSEENKAKYKYAVQHFAELNNRMSADGIKEKYIFHFLSPNSYDIFFNHLKDGSVLEGQDKFRCELENLLEEN